MMDQTNSSSRGRRAESYEWRWAEWPAEARGSELLAHDFVHPEPLGGYKIIMNFGVSLDRIVSRKLFNLINSFHW